MGDASKQMIEWLKEAKLTPEFQEFMGRIQSQRDTVVGAALKPGNTDLEKGMIISFDWVLLLQESLTGTDT